MEGSEATVYRVDWIFHICIQCCVKATNTSLNNTEKHSVQRIACFDLYIDSVDKQHSIHNTQCITLILCFNHLDMHPLMYTQHIRQ